jgi:hypothetical protein
MKMAVIWVVVPCSLLEVCQHLKGMCCLHHQGNESLIALMMEAAHTCESSVNCYQTTQCYNPEDSHLHFRCHENLKPHLTFTESSDVIGKIISYIQLTGLISQMTC